MLPVQSRRLKDLTEEQDAWKQACLHRWDAFLVDRDMQLLLDAPSTWRSAFRCYFNRLVLWAACTTQAMKICLSYDCFKPLSM